MTVLSDRLAYPNLSVCFLFETTAGERLIHWTAAAGGLANTWFASTIAGSSRTVEQVMESGAALTERASTALVDANAGSWYWDRATARIYVHCTGSASPYAKSLQAMIQFYFTDRAGRIYNGIYYDPRVMNLPTLSMRVEAKFGDAPQIGGGKLELSNQDGFFDLLSHLDWNAGATRILMAADDPLPAGWVYAMPPEGAYTEPGSVGAYTEVSQAGALVPTGDLSLLRNLATYAEHDVIGTWKTIRWEKTNAEFVLELEERKGVLKRKIPTAMWTRDDWPKMEEKSIGKVKQLAYGYVYDVRPVCVDVEAFRFRVAGHAVYDIAEVRVFDGVTESWVGVPISTKDAANAEFTLAPSVWTPEQEIACDFVGMRNPDGTIMENPSDVVADLIFVQAGEASAYKHSASFATSKTFFELGPDRFGHDVVFLSPGIHIEKETEVATIIGDINAAVGSYLFNDFDGKYRYVAFNPPQGNTAMPFSGDREIASFEENIDTKDVLSQIKVEYQIHAMRDFKQVYIAPRPSGQYFQQFPQAAVDVMERTPLHRSSDAAYVGQRAVRMRGEPARMYRARVNWRGWTLLPADYVHIQRPRGAVDAVFEVLEIKRSLANRMWVDLILGDLHGMKNEPGHWTEDAPVFPASLGGGSAETWDKNWTAAQKAYARQNFGYWSDDNGFADSTDPDSYNAGVWM